MHTEETVNRFLSSIPFDKSFTKPEVKKLHTLLNDTEILIFVISGNLVNYHARMGIAILTDKRIIFFRKSILGTETKVEFLIDKVSSVSIHKGLITSRIVVHGLNDIQTIDGCKHQAAEIFVYKLKETFVEGSQ